MTSPTGAPPPRRPLWARVAGFGAVGVAGFLVDAGLLLALKPYVGPIWGRAGSFAVAVATTFTLNRLFVFTHARDGPLLKQAGLFLLSNAAGLSLNLGAYTALVLSGWSIVSRPLVALATGSVAGAAANFLLADRFAFGRGTRAASDIDPTGA